MIRITAHSDPALFDAWAPQWRELLDDSDNDQIFLTTEWQKVWWEANQPGELLVLVARDEGSGRWLGLAPWYVAAEGQQKTVHAIGCEDVTDYLDVVSRRGYEDAVLNALLGYLAEHRAQFSEVRLCNLPDRSAALQRIPELSRQYGLMAQTRVLEVCPLIILPASFDEYISGLDKKNRHELRRKLRRAGGLADWYIVGPQHNLAEETQRFLSLMAASGVEKAAFLDERGYRKFFETLIPTMAQRGWMQLAFLTVKGEPAAAYLNFVYRNRVLVYNSGHNPALAGQLSPGIVLIARLIEHAIAEGREVFDFLRGAEPYKYDLGGRDTRVWELRLVPETEE